MIPSNVLFGSGAATASVALVGLGPFVWTGLTVALAAVARIAYDAWRGGVVRAEPAPALAGAVAGARPAHLRCVHSASNPDRRDAKRSVADAA